MLLSRLIGLVCEKRTQVVSSSVDNALNSPTLGTSGTTDMTTHALMILMEINQKYPIEMKNNGLQLMVSNESGVDKVRKLNELFSHARVYWIMSKI